MSISVDADRLDDTAVLAAADPGQMLRAVATSAAQVRESAVLAAEAGLDRLSELGLRPRALVVTGMGGSAASGDVLAAILGPGSAAPVVVHRGYGLPAWVGSTDVVAAVSCSGRTEETLTATEEALRRGAQVIGVGAPSSPLAELVAAGHGPYVGVDAAGRMPRSMLWALSMALLVAAEHLGLHTLPPTAVEAAATRLELLAQRCRPDSESFVNPAKTLALELAGTLPMVWGCSPIAGVAATRFALQLAENAKYPALSGVLPEANHNQVVALAGPLAGAAPESADFFRDRVGEEDRPLRLRLLLLRDVAEHPQVARRADASADLAAEYGVPVSALTAQGAGPLERLASLIGIGDFASVYLALLLGIDPTPIGPIDTLKARIADPPDGGH